ncbi:MAG: hypothetical protein JSS60_02905 [Verrucomicrobia bacterium]|nr:hypothetical protein [Verrucomicrobiota bacterium]
MMVIGYLLSSALLAAIANFFFRRNMEHGGSSKAFLSLYFLFSLFFSILFSPQIFHAPFSPVMAGVGAVAGILSYLMLTFTARALQLGPPGLTFTFQNASCIYPGLLLSLFFGKAYGFVMTPWILMGFLLILVGLFISARALEKDTLIIQATKAVWMKWILYAIAMMSAQGIILSIFQWRVLLMNCRADLHWLLPWPCQTEEDIWFMPAFFAIPALIQLCAFWKAERRNFKLREAVFGSSAGVLNCICTVLLLLSTKDSGPLKIEMIFPLFTVSVILFCNLWGWKIYKERVKWLGISLCILGVLVGLI